MYVCERDKFLNRVMTCEREERQIYITRKQCNKQFISVWTPLPSFAETQPIAYYLMTLGGVGGILLYCSLSLLNGVTELYNLGLL